MPEGEDMMKKIIIFILALALLLSACGNEEPGIEALPSGEEASIVPDEGAPAAMKVTAASGSEICVEIENLSEDELIFSSDFIIQYKENESWHKLEYAAENVVFSEIAFPIEAGEKREWKVSPEFIYGTLPEGEYRILKTVNVTENGKNESYRISADFVIKAKPDMGEFSPSENTESRIPVPDLSRFFGGEDISGCSFVMRANSSAEGGEKMLLRFASGGDEKNPVLLFRDAESLSAFVAEAENYYYLGEGEDSLREKLGSYDDDFFAEKIILLTHIEASSGSIEYEASRLDVSEGKCVFAINAFIPEVGTADMANWFIFTEQPAELFDDVTGFEVKINVKK